MKTTKKGYDLIKKWEASNKCKLDAYICPAGIPTIGWGTTTYPNGNKVKMGDKCTEKEANYYLEHYVTKYIEPNLNKYLDTKSDKVTNNMYDALASWCYNLGSNAINPSYGPNQIASLTNAGNYNEATRQIKLFNKVNGKTNQGLVNRREDEANLYNTSLPSSKKCYDVFISAYNGKLNIFHYDPSKIEAKIVDRNLSKYQDKYLKQMSVNSNKFYMFTFKENVICYDLDLNPTGTIEAGTIHFGNYYKHL